MSVLPIAGSRMLSKVKTTSAAVTGEPSEKRASGRTTTSITSSSTSIDSARSRRGSRVAVSIVVSPGTTRRESMMSAAVSV